MIVLLLSRDVSTRCGDVGPADIAIAIESVPEVLNDVGYTDAAKARVVGGITWDGKFCHGLQIADSVGNAGSQNTSSIGIRPPPFLGVESVGLITRCISHVVSCGGRRWRWRRRTSMMVTWHREQGFLENHVSRYR